MNLEEWKEGRKFQKEIAIINFKNLQELLTRKHDALYTKGVENE